MTPAQARETARRLLDGTLTAHTDACVDKNKEQERLNGWSWTGCSCNLEDDLRALLAHLAEPEGEAVDAGKTRLRDLTDAVWAQLGHDKAMGYRTALQEHAWRLASFLLHDWHSPLKADAIDAAREDVIRAAVALHADAEVTEKFEKRLRAELAKPAGAKE